jgi:hypothetical protein
VADPVDLLSTYLCSLLSPAKETRSRERDQISPFARVFRPMSDSAADDWPPVVPRFRSGESDVSDSLAWSHLSKSDMG